MKTKELNALVFPYILNAIDGSGYDKELTTDVEKLQFVCDCFRSEYGWHIEQVGKYNAFHEWLMGLPSSINIDFENYRIIEIVKEWSSIPVNATERQEQKILDNWFNFITCKFAVLCKRNKVEF